MSHRIKVLLHRLLCPRDRDALWPREKTAGDDSPAAYCRLVHDKSPVRPIGWFTQALWLAQIAVSLVAVLVGLSDRCDWAQAKSGRSCPSSLDVQAAKRTWEEAPIAARQTRDVEGQDVEGQAVEGQDGAIRLERFLESHGLTRLLIILVERQLDRTSVGPQRDQLVRKLARLYEDALANPDTSEDAENFQRLVNRAESLLRVNRHLQLDALKLAILAARFRELESAIRNWWYEGNDASQRNSLANSMREVFDAIDDIRRRNLERFQKLQAELPIDDNHEMRMEQLSEIERLVLKSQFLSGWAGVWISVLGEGSDVWAEEAIRHFRTFLELPDNEPIVSLEAKWYAFQTDWHVRAWVGMAYAHAQLDDLAAHAKIFEQLERTAVGDEVVLWQIDSYAFARQWRAILSKAQSSAQQMPSRVSRQSIWLAVARCAVAAERTDMAAPLAQLAVRGLLRDFQSAAVEQLLEDTLQPSWLDDVTRKWATALIILDKRDVDHAELEGALRSLRTIASEMEANGTSEDGGRIEYLIGLALYRLGQPAEARQHLARAAEELRDVSTEYAEAAAWLRIQALVASAVRDPDLLGETLAALDEFQTQFPANRHKGELTRLRNRVLANTLPPRLAVRRLQALFLQHPDDVGLAQELADQLFRYWRVVWRTDPEQAEQVGRTFDEVSQRLLDEPALQPRERARLQLRRVHMRLTRKEPLRDWNDELERLGQWESTIQADKELRRANQFVRLQIAILQDDRETAEALAREMLNSSLADSDVLPALIWLADDLRARGELSDELRQLAIQVNRRILEYYQAEKSDEMSPNAAVAAWELVKLLDQANRRDEALPWLERLVRAFPDRQPYLVQYARWLMDDERWSDALKLWRRLAIAASAGSELWYEAKWNVVRCLAHADPDAARKVAEQTRLLSPQMPEAWRKRFDREIEQLNSESDLIKPANDDEAIR